MISITCSALCLVSVLVPCNICCFWSCSFLTMLTFCFCNYNYCAGLFRSPHEVGLPYLFPSLKLLFPLEDLGLFICLFVVFHIWLIDNFLFIIFKTITIFVCQLTRTPSTLYPILRMDAMSLCIPGGDTQIWVGQGCAARASKPIPIFKGDFGQKGYPYLRIFLQK